jgi:hypothetical protein
LPVCRSDGIGGYYNGICIDQRYNTIRSLVAVHNTLVCLNAGSAGFRNGLQGLSGKAGYKIGVQCVKNNIFLHSLAGTEPAAVEGRCEADGNLYFNAHRSRDQWYEGLLRREPRSRWADAQLADVKALDFRLTPGSSAIDAAERLVPVRDDIRFDTDILGRPRGEKPDLGAVEFHPADTRPLLESFSARLMLAGRSEKEP